MESKTRLGIIGCGVISNTYLKNCARFENVEVAAVADLDPGRAEAQAAKYRVPRAFSVEEMMRDDGIEIIVNLTVPKAHAELALEALRHGKSVYNEKPLALDREQGAAVTALAREKGLRIGCAPDTFLGAGLQTCRKLLDAGAIGEPVAAVAFVQSGGVERWHPNPFFFYQAGGGPMFDMGVYYLTALTALLGPVRRLTGSARITRKQRPVSSEPFRGRVIDVEVPTHIAGIMDFAAGPVGTLITSFDVSGLHSLPYIEIYGSEGTMRVPDPNTFAGPVFVNKSGEKEWREMRIPFGYGEDSRGVGLADMAAAIRSKRPHRASGEMAAHVLDIMQAFHESSAQGRHIDLKSRMERPEPFPEGLAFGQAPA